MKTSEDNPSDWFFLARERLESADALVAAKGVCYSVVELLQESVERYLKGFLVSRGWQLERIHDLSRLLDLTTFHRADFSRFQFMVQSLTEQFWEQHYPGGDLDGVGQDYPELRQALGELVALIESTLVP